MGKKVLNNTYLSMLCAELAMLLDAGLTTGDSVQVLKDDEPGKEGKAILQKLTDSLEKGEHFSQALQNAEAFPKYMIHMVEIGERTGRLVETLRALAEYYERQVRLSVTIKNSVLYPAILLILMIAVVLVLIVQVLPIFNDVFARLGTQMSPLATALMNFGGWLGNAAVAIAAIFAAIFIIIILIFSLPSLRTALSKAFTNKWGSKGIFGKIASSRFIYAMRLSMASGLDTGDAIDLAAQVSGGSKAIDEKHRRCTQLISEGKPLHEAMTGAGILSGQDGKMLSIGTRSGKSDQAMAEIARRSDLDVSDSMDRIVGRIEPTLVIISSVIVGIILLSVMLPLMGIMTAIG
ncbi:MAG: type II secretion system F family protein [Oscillospiraceae bacterium]|nr:type II secretion system F family protein [Oscillospiraceae bacterium]